MWWWRIGPARSSFRDGTSVLLRFIGLYQGFPLDRRGFYYGNVLPDKITLFQIPIESMCQTKEEVEKKVKEVVNP